MKPSEIVSLFRKEMADEATPPLWSDEEIVNYLDDAQKMFCRETGGLPDSTSSITTVDLAIGDVTFDVDVRILKIRSGYRVSDGRRISIVNYEEMESKGMRFDGQQAPVYAIIIGMDEVQARPYPIPSVAETLQLVIDRMPLEDITMQNVQSVSLEVNPRHHRHLMMWMKKLGYEKQDSETFNKTKSVEFEKKFLAYCEQARLEKERRKHKTRVVVYGGMPMRAPVSREDKDY